MGYPIIGIVCKHYPMVANGRSERPYSLIDDEAKQAIIDVGAVPIGIVSPKREVELAQIRKPATKCLSASELALLRRQLGMCQGLLLQGGRLVDDYLYAIAELAYEQDIPTLGICSGQTAMGRALGTKVISVDKDTHARWAEEYVHEAIVVPGSRFHKIVAETDRVMVNSRHQHEIIPNDKFRAGALSPDGNAEVAEAPDKKFYMGVRFHPESLYRVDSLMRKIFEAFVNACEK